MLWYPAPLPRPSRGPRPVPSCRQLNIVVARPEQLQPYSARVLAAALIQAAVRSFLARLAASSKLSRHVFSQLDYQEEKVILRGGAPPSPPFPRVFS